MSTRWGLHNGEGGIRTPDRGISPYNGLANRRLQPLGHLSNVAAVELSRQAVVVEGSSPSGATSGHPNGPNMTGVIESKFKEVFEHKAFGGGGLARRHSECVPGLLECHTFRRKQATHGVAAEPRSQSKRGRRAR